ncbi:MAG: metalloregulator ArsR/SmtB family transcription factor [Paracoccaceae bacterium]
MEIQEITQSLTTLGHAGRLSVFRLLMRHMPQGVRPTEIAEVLGLKQNTLSHHLSDLESAGLITVLRQGRSLYYHANVHRMAGIVDYLINDCCRGRPEMCQPPLHNMESIVTQRPWNVLFICSGNSARSIFAEAILADIGKGKFNAYSAGTRPGTTLNPFALEVLARSGLDVTGMRSKHVSEFEAEGAPKMDFVFTVCDQAASEECAPWPGQPMTAHWGLPDPVRATGTDAEKALAFADAYSALRRRILAIAALPFAELEKLALQQHLDAIGKD